jgi:hypothetical protein
MSVMALMNVGWIARQPLPQFFQNLTFACGSISDADAAIDLAQAKFPATAIAFSGEVCFQDTGARYISSA